MEIAFITNICPHYHIKTFEVLAHYYDVDYCFFSAGDEWYWEQKHGMRMGEFRYKYLPGFHLGRTRVTPSLVTRLWQGNYDVFVKCITGRFALPATFLIAKLRRRPFVLWTGMWMHPQTLFHRLSFPVTRYIYHHADAIVVYGEHVKRYLVGLGVKAEKVFIAAHAVDNDLYSRSVSEEEKAALRDRLGLSSAPKVVLYLGRLEESKGLCYLIEAFAMLPRDDTVLIFVGDGGWRARLEAQSQRRGLAGSVRFPGYVPPGETLPYYALADVFVLPSVTVPAGKEPWGLVVNEAMNQGVPVVATDAVGAAAGGLVQDGANGFVVHERDSVALSQAIERILSDRELRHRMSQNARRIVAEWDNERMVEGFRQAVEFTLGLQRRDAWL